MSPSHTPPSSSNHIEANTVKKTRSFHAIDYRGKKPFRPFIGRKTSVEREIVKKSTSGYELMSGTVTAFSYGLGGDGFLIWVE
jgi:hypothetical protein